MKKSPPDGTTGKLGIDLPTDELLALLDASRGNNLALRLASNIVGMDVDAYDDKHGDVTLADIERQLGPLPETWSSTSRGEGPSRILLFSLPPGITSDGWKSGLGNDIEIIRFGHRYAMVWPSIHPSGNQYQWYTPAGTPHVGAPPGPEMLPELPLAWIEELSANPQVGARAKDSGVSRMFADV